MPIRTTRLAAAALPTATLTTLVTANVGEAVIVKSLIAYSTGAVSSEFLVRLKSADGTVLMRFIDQTLAASQILTYSGWIVLNAGDAIDAESTAAAVNVWVSGTRLPSTP